MYTLQYFTRMELKRHIAYLRSQLRHSNSFSSDSALGRMAALQQARLKDALEYRATLPGGGKTGRPRQ